jgi:hypothetical protein
LGRTELSTRELSRVEVMARVKAGSLVLQEAAELLELSYRQTKRMWARYRGGERRRCSTGTADGDRIVPTQGSFAVGCSIGCRNAMRISVRRWRVSTWRATTG